MHVTLLARLRQGSLPAMHIPCYLLVSYDRRTPIGIGWDYPQANAGTAQVRHFVFANDADEKRKKIRIFQTFLPSAKESAIKILTTLRHGRMPITKLQIRKSLNTVIFLPQRLPIIMNKPLRRAHSVAGGVPLFGPPKIDLPDSEFLPLSTLAWLYQHSGVSTR